MIRWIILSAETAGLCLVFFLLCFLGTGGDIKNMKSFSSYPDEVQEIVKKSDLASGIKVGSPWVSFFSNIAVFTVVLFALCMVIRQSDFWGNFVNVAMVGQILNAFDFLVIDLLWWRNSKRVRFSGTEDRAELYKNPKKHFISFLKGIVVFFIVAVIDGLLLWALSVVW